MKLLTFVLLLVSLKVTKFSFSVFTLVKQMNISEKLAKSEMEE